MMSEPPARTYLVDVPPLDAVRPVMSSTPQQAPPYRLYVWDAHDRVRDQEAGGVAHEQDDAQQALVTALEKMTPGARGQLRTARLDLAFSDHKYHYDRTLMTGVRTPYGVRLRQGMLRRPVPTPGET
jgi:hypothetical protein